MTYLITILGLIVSTMFALLFFREEHELQAYPSIPPPAPPPSSSLDKKSIETVQHDAVKRAALDNKVPEDDVADLVALADETRL